MISIRPTGEGDLAALGALFAACFGHPMTAEEWRWKYRRLPGEGRSLVAVDGSGAVLAHGGALCLPARWRGGEGGIWQLADFMGTPAGGGLRPPLVELGRQLLADLPRPADAPWIFGFPSERHFRLGERVFGYRPLASFTPLAAALPERPPSAGESHPPSSADRAGLMPPSNAACRLEISDSCGDWAPAIWERCGVLGVRRSAAFLNWRYWARPQRYYRFYRLIGDGEEGLAVFALVGAEAWAAELWLPAAGEWYAAMLAVAADLRASGLRLWRCWPPPFTAPRAAAGANLAAGADPAGSDPVAALLRRLGLQPSGEARFVGCRCAATGAAGPIAAASGFYYAMGDYDLV